MQIIKALIMFITLVLGTDLAGGEGGGSMKYGTCINPLGIVGGLIALQWATQPPLWHTRLHNHFPFQSDGDLVSTCKKPGDTYCTYIRDSGIFSYSRLYIKEDNILLQHYMSNTRAYTFKASKAMIFILLYEY